MDNAQPIMLTAALWYATRGWHVFPCRGKVPWISRAAGGHGYKDATVEPKQITAWWTQWPDANIGLATGHISGVWVLDVDCYKGGQITLDDLIQSYTALPQTVQSLTTNSGVHWFFRTPTKTTPQHRIPPTCEALGPGLDVRGDGGYVILPPSTIKNRAYCWELSSHPSDIPLAEAPDWLLALVQDSKPHHAAQTAPRHPWNPVPLAPIIAKCGWLRHCRDDAATLTEPSWYGMLTLLGRCQDGEATAHKWSQPYPGYTIAETAQKLHHAIVDTGPLTCTYIRTALDGETYCATCPSWGKITSPIRLSNVTPPDDTHHHVPTPWGDVFNAEAMVRLHGENLRYCTRWDAWFLWSGKHWQHDETGQVMELARSTIRSLIQDAALAQDKNYLSYLSKCFSHGKLTAMLAQASTMPGIVVLPEVFDADPWLLNCCNGTLDLRTATLHAHIKANYLTKCLPIIYDAEAVAPQWQRFLWRIMGGTNDQDTVDMSAGELENREAQDAKATRLISFLQRAVGYALTGVTNEDCLFLLYGSGRNGKSRFLDACHALLDSYAKTAQMTTFLHQDRETVRND